MKYDTYSKYDPRGVALAESAFLTVWSALGSFRHDLVLVGGLVPKYLCGDTSESRTLPRPATLDVDIGIALGASSDQYGSILWDLQGQGFCQSKRFPTRFEKEIEGFTVYVDFLVEQPGATQGVVVVDDIPANILPGINRALETAREIAVEGIDLLGANQQLPARVCEIGSFLTLKLRAFARRQQPKDAFDILYSLLHYDKGTEAAVTAFAMERESGNSAYPDAVKCLEDHFKAEDSAAPMKASHFIFGEQQRDDSEDLRLQRLQIRQDVVSAGQMLLQAVSLPEEK